jgi:hypothetical protein
MLFNRRPNHISYLVPGIEQAAFHWTSVFGAGPFFIFERVTFDEATHLGKPCVFDHSAAFGQWGPVVIELQQIFTSAPTSLTEKLIPSHPPVVNHVAFVSPAAEEDSAQLAASGYSLFLYARINGAVEVRFHDTARAFGHAVEIHQQSSFLDDFFREVAGASQGWDGRTFLRPWK